MSPAFLEWLYFVGVMAVFVAVVVAVFATVAGIVIAVAIAFRKFRPSKESS